MKVSKEQAAQNRERILEVGTRLFRERGFDGIGVADLMREAGLTHGGFYGHFASKEELMAKACERALAKSAARWESLYARDGREALAAMADSYLSTRHRDHPGGGCIAPAVAIEAARHGPAVRRAFTDGVRSLVDVLARVVPGRTKAAKRKRGAGHVREHGRGDRAGASGRRCGIVGGHPRGRAGLDRGCVRLATLSLAEA